MTPRYWLADPFEKDRPAKRQQPMVTWSGFTVVHTERPLSRASRPISSHGVRAFRFCRSTDLDFYRAGSFRLSTLRKLAKNEALGPLWDKDEGRLVVNSSGPFVHSRGVDEVFDETFDIPDVMMDGVAVERVLSDCWVLCLSERPDAEVNAGVYDKVIEIDDVLSLALALRDGSKGLLGDPMIGYVDYLPRRRLHGDAGPVESAFIKGTGFREEKEIRICWPALQALPEEGGMADFVVGETVAHLSIPD